MKKIIDKILNIYIELNFGYEIDKFKKNKIKNIIGHLVDNDYDEIFIINYLLKNGPILIDELWDNSLLKPNTFYYHNKLRITPECAIWNVYKKEECCKFYLEMKINFTIDDLLNYFYTTFNVPLELRDYKRDIGAFNHMLGKRYVKDVETIDYLLALIDYNKVESIESGTFISNPFELKFQTEVYNKFQYIINNSKYNKIIWRDYNDV